MEKVLISCALLFSLIFAGASVAESEENPTTKKDQFFAAYKAYTQSLENSPPAQVARLAVKALELGEQVFPENHKTLPVLQQNAGSALVKAKKLTEAEPILRRALNNFEKLYGGDSIELLNTLMDLGHAQQTPSKSVRKKHYRNALRIAKKHKGEESLLVASLNGEIGSWLMVYAQSSASKNYLKTSLDLYRKNLPENDYRVGLAAFNLAKYKMARYSFDEAEKLLLSALRAFHAPNKPANQLELAAHAFLVEAYERREQREQANKHVQAIATARPWTPDQEPRAIFKEPAIYPSYAFSRRIEGYVTTSFTIDKNGFAIDPVVIESDGHKGFEKAAIKAVKKWRFVPRFENGHAVETLNSTVRVVFSMDKMRR